MGLLFNASSFALVDNTNFKLNATAGTVSATGGKLADHILGRLIDTAADKHYPWVTYKYAARMDGGITNTSVTIPSGGAISGTAISFSLLPNQIVILPSTTSGYHDFMSATYTVN
jgi:predicted outer membrane repeat protein